MKIAIKKNQEIFLLFFIVCFAMFNFSCSSNRQVIKRDNYGLDYRKKPLTDPAFNPLKKKVALLSFFNESPYGGDDLAVVATEELRRELSRTRDYLVDPTAETIFGGSKEIFSSGGTQLVQLAKKAKMAGVNLVVYGRIVKARVRQHTDEVGVMRDQRSFAESEIELRVFDIHSGKELYSERQQGNVDDKAYRFYLDEKNENTEYRRQLMRYSIQIAVRKFMPKIIDLGQKLEWIGRVAKIIGTKIYVNAGRESGIQVGDVLKVTTEGQEIIDPETGALIGYSEGDTKGTVEIIDYFGPDGSIAILHSGGSVTEGDFVQLY